MRSLRNKVLGMGGNWRFEEGEGGRQEIGDRRQETGDRRQEAGDRRQETKRSQRWVWRFNLELINGD